MIRLLGAWARRWQLSYRAVQAEGQMASAREGEAGFGSFARCVVWTAGCGLVVVVRSARVVDSGDGRRRCKKEKIGMSGPWFGAERRFWVRAGAAVVPAWSSQP